jgi:hypothetical protein
MHTRSWLVSGSLIVHFVLIVGLFVAGAWRLERLDPVARRFDLAVALPPPPAPAGGPSRAITPSFVHKPITHNVVQPVPKPLVAMLAAPTADPGDNGSGSASGSGEGSGSAGDTGECTSNCGPGSGSHSDAGSGAERETIVAPPVLGALRLSGPTQIQPSDKTKIEVSRAGVSKLSASFKLCLDTLGNVSSVQLMKPTGYPDYDLLLIQAIHTWRYRPYTVANHPIPVCGMVTFIYSAN